jgi:hypothetical protein
VGPISDGSTGGGQEGRADGVAAGGRQVEVDDLAEEGVGHLQEDARTVAGGLLRADGASVLEVRQCKERRVHDVASGVATRRGDHRDAARVVLVARVVKALCGRHLSPAHRPSSLGARRAPILLCGECPRYRFDNHPLPFLGSLQP